MLLFCFGVRLKVFVQIIIFHIFWLSLNFFHLDVIRICGTEKRANCFKKSFILVMTSKVRQTMLLDLWTDEKNQDCFEVKTILEKIKFHYKVL